jgi:hypothetical protein
MDSLRRGARRLWIAVGCWTLLLAGGGAGALVAAAAGSEYGLTVLLGFVALMGLIGMLVMAGHARVLSRLAEPGQQIASWTVEPAPGVDPDDTGDMVVGREGVWWRGTVYPFHLRSSRLDGISIANGRLVYDISTQSKAGRQKIGFGILIPKGREEAARQIVQALSS